jgi:hypothetical protein
VVGNVTSQRSANRFTNAKEAAIIPALVALIVKVASKNIGNIETTASSAPKLAK